jgi:hypothetical protein
MEPAVTIADIDGLTGYTPQPIVLRLALRSHAGEPLALGLTKADALWLVERIDSVLPVDPPAVCPTWDGGPNPFSAEILAEYDRNHPIPVVPVRRVA